MNSAPWPNRLMRRNKQVLKKTNICIQKAGGSTTQCLQPPVLLQ